MKNLHAKSQKSSFDGHGKASSPTTRPQPKNPSSPTTREAHDPIPLVTNYFRVGVNPQITTDACFYQYNVSLTYNERPLDNVKDIGRKVMDKVHQSYLSELDGEQFAYDGDKTLFTIGFIQKRDFHFDVVLEDASTNRGSTALKVDGESARERSNCSKAFKVRISFTKKIPMHPIVRASEGQPFELSQEVVRVLDIILRQHAAKKGCLVVRQSFFSNSKSINLGSGVLGCGGFNSSFRATQGGLFLNMDVSNTPIIQSGPVINFLFSNQNVKSLNQIDWNKAIRMLKNLRVKASHTNAERRIRGLSEKPCKQQTFLMKQGNEGTAGGEIKVTVYDYFVNHKKINLKLSVDFPCINVGKSGHPVYIPLELCELVSLQRYTKPLSTEQRSSLVEKSRQKPQDRKEALEGALKSNDYDKDPMLRASGISITTKLTEVDGRILPAPTLEARYKNDLFPLNGSWNLKNQQLADPAEINSWLVANFSSGPNMEKDINDLIKDLIGCAKEKGIEESRRGHDTASDRVDKMIRNMRGKLDPPPSFILCILPQKNCDIYGPWKLKCLSQYGIPTQCIVLSSKKTSDYYLTNVVLKINAKVGGLNFSLRMDSFPSLNKVSSKPTLILGMDVSHGPPGQADVPSIAAVVNSRHWPSICHYRAAVRTQSPKSEMIDSLFKVQYDSRDSGIIRGALMDFYTTSAQRNPEQIIFFRDGVGESQFQHVLDNELKQIREACNAFKPRNEQCNPKFMVIVAQKRHHTRFFKNNSESYGNVTPGTVVDQIICNHIHKDFYLCAHAGVIGTSRPTHYHVLLDEIGFSENELQSLVHSLCYIHQRSTKAVSLVAPICYAHLAAAQAAEMFKSLNFSASSSGPAAASPSQPAWLSPAAASPTRAASPRGLSPAAASPSPAAASPSQPAWLSPAAASPTRAAASPSRAASPSPAAASPSRAASPSPAAASCSQAAAQIPQLPPFHKDVADSMFFC